MLKKYFSEFRISHLIIIVLMVIGGIIGGIEYYEQKYPCQYGHYEDVWVPNYVHIDGFPYQAGGYYTKTFICDCRTERK